jgi:porphobilinogen synthase
MPFPIHRLRRLRRTESLRSLVRETRLHPAQFILPLFVCPGEGVARNRLHAGQLPDVDRRARQGVRRGAALGIGGVILFGLPESKDEMATGAYDENGIVQRAIRAIKRETPAAGDDRRLQLRIHQPRALRLRQGRRRG